MAAHCSITNRRDLRRYIEEKKGGIWDRINRVSEVHHDEEGVESKARASGGRVIQSGEQRSSLTELAYDKENNLIRTLTFPEGKREPSSALVAHYFGDGGDRFATVEGKYSSILALEQRTETIADVVRSPLKSAWEMGTDFTRAFRFVYEKKSWKPDLASFGAALAIAVPHEFLHAGANLLLGGQNERIVFNKLLGGKLLEYLLPDVTSEYMLPFIAGKVEPKGGLENMELMHAYAVCVAPYILAPIGIYCAQKAQGSQSKLLAATGGATIMMHMGAVIGDFGNLGRLPLMKVASELHEIELQTGSVAAGSLGRFATLAAIPAGFYIGWKVASFSYRLCKAAVTTGMDVSEKVEQRNDLCFQLG